MKRIIIICEGQTEQMFCEQTLSPYFSRKEINIQPSLINSGRGGITGWHKLKREIENYLKQDQTVYVSMLVDYYGIYKEHQFPSWEESFKMADKSELLNFLEQKMKEDINPSFGYRFIPYMQLHEFEGLLFNNIDVFRQQFTTSELAGMAELQETFKQFGGNPEMINNNKETAPSKRLERIIRGYNKVVYGNILAEAIGLENIKSKCPRFNGWISKIENI
ncbi:hypothetical protein Barb7_02448 [Bacteroidales bacterium Barb7]|nr:hypothetical protein Barb7_02448 [Bacteroidales bacterium Barb7]